MSKIMSAQLTVDYTIGRLDRLLSEFLLLVNGPLDAADAQTLKHHADDLIGVGNKALETLEARLTVTDRPVVVPSTKYSGTPFEEDDNG